MRVGSIDWSSAHRGLLGSLFTTLALGAMVCLVLPAQATAEECPDPLDCPQPDIVFVLLDDMNADMLQHMSRIQTELQDQGTTFGNFFLPTPVCCPSRSNFLLGDFSHDHDVWEVANSIGGYGGYYAFKTIGEHEESVVARAMQQDHGYRTALLGKYFNWYPHDGYPCVDDDTPPGCGSSLGAWNHVPGFWDTWKAFLGGMPHMSDYFGSALNECDQCPTGVSRVLTAANVYNTDYLREKAVDFITSTPANQPLFLWLAPVAPHKGGPNDRPVPPTRYESSFPTETWPDKPSLFEADLTDKPTWIQNQAPLNPVVERPKMDAYFRDALRTVKAVEDLLFNEDGVIQTLADSDRLENTYIFLASDNGYHYGEHGLKDGKRTFFEEDIRVPLIVRGPGVPTGVTLPHLVANIDLARTFLELAGGNASPDLDGRSLMPLLRPAAAPENWRQAMLLERMWSDAAPPDDSYGVRTQNHKYLTYPGPEEQLYDLQSDPYELSSAHQDPAQADRKADLSATLAALKSCDGSSCRSWEGRNPEGNGRKYVAALFNPCITTAGNCTARIVWDTRYIENANLMIFNKFGTPYRCRPKGETGHADAGPWNYPSRLDIYDTEVDCFCGATFCTPDPSELVQSLHIGKAFEDPPRATGQIVTLPEPCVPVEGFCEVSVFVRTANLNPDTYDWVEVRLQNGALWRQWPVNTFQSDITGPWVGGNSLEFSLYPRKTGHGACQGNCDPADPSTNLGPRLDFAHGYKPPP